MSVSRFRQTLFKKQFLLVRHGESIWNKDSKFTGWTDIPLTDNGRKEAEKIACALLNFHLFPNVIFSSVLERCIETSNIIKKINDKFAKTDIPVYTSWRLNERHYGTLEGVPRQYIRDKYGNQFTKFIRSNYNMKPPLLKDYEYLDNEPIYPIYRNCYFKTVKNGESKENVLQRVLPYYENDILYTLSENKLPLIVTHKHTARVLMKHLLKIEDENFEYYDLPDKKILLIRLHDDLTYDNHIEITY